MQSWPMKVYSSKFILPETKKVQIFAVFAWICFKVLFFFQKWQLTIESIEPLFGEICVFVFFLRGILRISKIGFIVFVHCFNRHFRFLGTVHCVCSLFSWHFRLTLGLCHPKFSNQIPLQVVLREEKKTNEICGRCDGGMTGNAVWSPWIKSKV